MGAVSNGAEQLDHGVADQFSRAAVNFTQQGQPRLSFRQGNNTLVMPFANNGIRFPIPNPLTLLNNLRALFNTSTIGQITPAVTVAIALAAFILTAQVLVQVTSTLFIAQDVLIYPLVTNLDIIVFQQPARNLFWAPFHTNFGFHQRPGFSLDPAFNLLSPPLRQGICLLWSITSLTTISAQLSTYRGFIHSYKFGDLGLIYSHFHKRIYLVSLFLGKLFVGSHKCSFDLADQEALILPQLTSFSARKVALES
jgi:hypothetical protein